MTSDYFSREAAKKELCERCSDFTMCTRSDNDCPITRGLNSLPAADVVEVVHASWVWNPDGMDWGIGAWVCGKCKSRPETWWNTVKECHPLRCSGSRYCGNCGAKMDGGQDK